MDSLSLILNLAGLAAKFIPEGGGALGTIITLLATYGAPISALVKAGAPVEQAIVEHSPELWSAIKQFAAAFGDDHPVNVTAIATAIIAPHMTTDAERAWMDRASQTTGL